MFSGNFWRREQTNKLTLSLGIQKVHVLEYVHEQRASA